MSGLRERVTVQEGKGGLGGVIGSPRAFHHYLQCALLIDRQGGRRQAREADSGGGAATQCNMTADPRPRRRLPIVIRMTALGFVDRRLRAHGLRLTLAVMRKFEQKRKLRAIGVRIMSAPGAISGNVSHSELLSWQVLRCRINELSTRVTIL